MAADKFQLSDLKENETGYSARLITFDELVDNLGYGDNEQGSIQHSKNDNTPNWVYNSNYCSWSMSSFEDFDSSLWSVNGSGNVTTSSIYYGYDLVTVVRPVVTLLKSAIK